MDLSYTETQRMLLDVTREFAANETPKARVREIDDSPSGFSPELWQQMASLGLPGMAVPETHGGTAASLMDYGVVFEALGESAVPSPLLASAFASFLLRRLGDGDDLLRSAASGERLAAVALTEAEDYGWEPSSVQLAAETADSGFILRGAKSFVPYAAAADELLTIARTDEGPSVFRVPADAPGLGMRRQSGWLGEPVYEVRFDGVRLEHAALLGSNGGAWPAIEEAMDRSTALLCAYMLGGAQKVTNMAIAYSKTRHAFGLPIGAFQRVQDLVIAALNDADAIRWSTYEALWKLDESKPDAQVAVSMAKAIANEGFARACENSHYVHAGVGMDLDFGLTHHTKRSRFYSLYLGSADWHKLRMARLLGL